jgi:pimeloyl-ACP methyl ester carboxylesterase
LKAAGPTAWRAIDWAERSRSLVVAGRRVHLVSLGSDGVPLLLLHGTGGSWRHWLCNLPALAARRAVYAIDLPGFGGSQLPESEITVDGYARTVLAVADQLGHERFDVIGHSLGGLVATELAAHHSQRVRKLVLVGGTANAILAIARSPVRGSVRHPGVAALVLAEILLGMQRASEGLAKATATRARLRKLALGFAVHRPEELSPDLTASLIASAGSPGFLPAVRAHRGHAVTVDRNATIANPVLAITGRRDRLTPPRELIALRRRWCDLQTLVMDDAGHLPMVERPRRFNDSVSVFFEPGSGQRSD